MKASNYSNGSEGGDHLGFRARSSTHAETTAFVTLGLVGATAVVIALVSASTPLGARKDPMTDTASYVRSGQFIADMRTVSALVHYLFENGPSMTTNVIEPGPLETNLATPTNMLIVTPRA